ncbi:molybdopterin-binding protein [Chloroflexota bacterium]
MKTSARNMIKGKVKEVKKGAVNSIVILELPGGDEIVSVITNESVERLDLAQGKPAYAMIKASNVMIAVD